MTFLKTSVMTILMAVALLVFSTMILYAQEREAPFPQYGQGPVEVRIYSDFFCPPCRAMEPLAEPVLQELLKRNAITLIIVDVPRSPQSVMYAKYFLYALKMINNPDHAFHVRNVLKGAAAERLVMTEAHIEELFKSNKIEFAVSDVRASVDRYNALIKEDKVQATPTCVIIMDGKKETFVGTGDVVAALKRLLQT